MAQYSDDSAITQLDTQHFTSAQRAIRLRLGSSDMAPEEILFPQRVQGYEAICEGFELRVYCLSLSSQLQLKTLIGLPAEVQIVTDKGQLRSICGIVT